MLVRFVLPEFVRFILNVTFCDELTHGEPTSVLFSLNDVATAVKDEFQMAVRFHELLASMLMLYCPVMLV